MPSYLGTGARCSHGSTNMPRRGSPRSVGQTMHVLQEPDHSRPSISNLNSIRLTYLGVWVFNGVRDDHHGRAPAVAAAQESVRSKYLENASSFCPNVALWLAGSAWLESGCRKHSYRGQRCRACHSVRGYRKDIGPALSMEYPNRDKLRDGSRRSVLGCEPQQVSV